MKNTTCLLVQRIRKFAREHLKKKDKILVAVSGGPDSVALLHLLLELQEEYELKLVLAHLEHGIRGEESREQATFVRNLGERLGLDCFIRYEDVPRLSRTQKWSMEEAAREARYHFFREIAQRAGTGKIALGHTADDQAETLLMRLLRGAGTEGLAAMRPIRREGEVVLVRPLLNVFRREILDFLNDHKISFCLDSTNCEPDYLRNKIRLQLIPLLSREYNHQILSTLHRTALVLGEQREWMSSQAKEKLQQCLLPTGEGKEISLDLFLALPMALQREVLREAIQQVSSSPYKTGFIKVSAIIKWLKEGRPGGALHLSGRLHLKKQAGTLRIEIKKPETVATVGNFCYRLNIPGETFIPELNLRVSSRILEKFHTGGKFEAGKAYLDFDDLPSPLFIRKRRQGDRFQPLGLSGHKKLKKFFIDEKVPRPGREKIPVVACGQEVVWVFGRRIAEPFKVTEKTARILLIEKIDLSPGDTDARNLI